MSCLQALNELVLVPYLPSPPRAFCSSPAVVGLADTPLPQGLCTCCPRCGGALPLDVPRAHSLTRFSSEASPGHLSITVTCSSEGRPLCLACSLLGPSCWCHFSSSGTLTPRASSSNTSSPPSAHSPPKPQHVPLQIPHPTHHLTYLLFFLVRILKFYSHSEFQVYNQVLSISHHVPHLILRSYLSYK